MLTRLKVSGFKNLVDVDVRFGAFTCIAGANGVGKSNLFDAIRFLSALANNTLMDAALAVRSEGGKAADVRSLFHRVGAAYDEEMTFEAEMIVPGEGTDDLGQKAKAAITFLRYSLSLAYRRDDNSPTLGRLELVREALTHINRTEASGYLRFPHEVKSWRKSVLSGRRTSPFISTKEQTESTKIVLSQDGKSGRPRSFLAATLPRTVLSTVNATESPTALLARREMQSWRLLQLEPSALREPDSFTTPPGLGYNGSHLAATVAYLVRSALTEAQVYGQLTIKLADLLGDVHSVRVDRDEKRELLTLEITDREGTVYPARSLSDGTLRFLALAVLALDPGARGVICLEEPENGIHPERIPAMLRLLQDIAVDVKRSVGLDNPLRQVIVNTHSPAVVSQVLDSDLLVAELKETVRDGLRFRRASFAWLPDSWRAEAELETPTVSKARLLSYLNPVEPVEAEPEQTRSRKPRRVIDRPDLQPYLPLFADPG